MHKLLKSVLFIALSTSAALSAVERPFIWWTEEDAAEIKAKIDAGGEDISVSTYPHLTAGGKMRAAGGSLQVMVRKTRGPRPTTEAQQSSAQPETDANASGRQ